VCSNKSPFLKKILATPALNKTKSDIIYKKQTPTVHSDKNHSIKAQINNNKSDIKTPDKPKLIDNIKYIEQLEEKKKRAIDFYGKLQEYATKYDVELSTKYTMDSNPDDMEAEYLMHKEKRNKHNQVKFYKGILLTVVSGAEFVNERYNPFEFKLKDWSKQVALETDDYTEIFEELYEKYKDTGGTQSPEVRLIFKLVMSCVTYHVSNYLLGSGGLASTLSSNPNILGKLMSSFTGGMSAPTEQKSTKPNNNDILEALKKHNNVVKSENKTNQSESHTEVPVKQPSAINQLNIDKKMFELEKQQFEEHKNQVTETLIHKQTVYQNQLKNIEPHTNEPVNIKNIMDNVESDLSYVKHHMSDEEMFESEAINMKPSRIKLSQSKKSMDEVSDSLDNLDTSIINSTSKKK